MKQMESREQQETLMINLKEGKKRQLPENRNRQDGRLIV